MPVLRKRSSASWVFLSSLAGFLLGEPLTVASEGGARLLPCLIIHFVEENIIDPHEGMMSHDSRTGKNYVAVAK
jgi:hypothetical protein